MRSSKRFAPVVGVLLALGVPDLYGQGQSSGQIPSAVRSRAEEMLEWWNQVGGKLSGHPSPKTRRAKSSLLDLAGLCESSLPSARTQGGDVRRGDLLREPGRSPGRRATWQNGWRDAAKSHQRCF
jgi:hypothetical protein